MLKSRWVFGILICWMTPARRFVGQVSGHGGSSAALERKNIPSFADGCARSRRDPHCDVDIAGSLCGVPLAFSHASISRVVTGKSNDVGRRVLSFQIGTLWLRKRRFVAEHRSHNAGAWAEPHRRVPTVDPPMHAMRIFKMRSPRVSDRSNRAASASTRAPKLRAVNYTILMAPAAPGSGYDRLRRRIA